MEKRELDKLFDLAYVAKLEDENEELRKTVERLEAELIDYRRWEE